jgi:hypothetical protein
MLREKLGVGARGSRRKKIYRDQGLGGNLDGGSDTCYWGVYGGDGVLIEEWEFRHCTAENKAHDESKTLRDDDIKE